MSLDSVLDILKTFEGHVGRKGQRGGSLPRGDDALGQEMFAKDREVYVGYGTNAYEITKKLFGRDLTDIELANLVGAPAGSEIYVGMGIGRIIIRANKRGFESTRIVENVDGELVLKNDSMSLKNKNTGIGARSFASQVNQALKLGVTKIQAFAARGEGMNGYYTWARLGYQNEGALSSEIRTLTGKETVQAIMKTKEGREIWKERGESFDGIFDLTKGSTSRKILSNYVKAKGYYYGQ